jgi:hypothetical protein
MGGRGQQGADSLLFGTPTRSSAATDLDSEAGRRRLRRIRSQLEGGNPGPLLALLGREEPQSPAAKRLRRLLAEQLVDREYKGLEVDELFLDLPERDSVKTGAEYRYLVEAIEEELKRLAGEERLNRVELGKLQVRSLALLGPDATAPLAARELAHQRERNQYSDHLLARYHDRSSPALEVLRAEAHLEVVGQAQEAARRYSELLGLSDEFAEKVIVFKPGSSRPLLHLRHPATQQTICGHQLIDGKGQPQGHRPRRGTWSQAPELDPQFAARRCRRCEESAGPGFLSAAEEDDRRYPVIDGSLFEQVEQRAIEQLEDHWRGERPAPKRQPQITTRSGSTE